MNDGKEEGGLVMVGHCISKFSYESATPVKPGKRLAPMGETTLCKRMGVEVPHCAQRSEWNIPHRALFCVTPAHWDPLPGTRLVLRSSDIRPWHFAPVIVPVKHWCQKNNWLETNEIEKYSGSRIWGRPVRDPTTAATLATCLSKNIEKFCKSSRNN